MFTGSTFVKIDPSDWWAVFTYNTDKLSKELLEMRVYLYTLLRYLVVLSTLADTGAFLYPFILHGQTLIRAKLVIGFSANSLQYHSVK